MPTDPPISPLGLSMMGPDDGSDPTRRLIQAMMLNSANSSPRPGLDATGDTHIPLDPPQPRTASPSPASDLLQPPRGGNTDDPSINDIHPAGFTDDGMPTEFPATSRMKTAHDMLQKAQHPPHELRNTLIMGGLGTLGTLLAARGGNTFAGAGVAQGFERAMDTMYQRKQNNISRANQQYEFESGQEEKQRESALRERLAMTQMESTRAYRDLLVEMRKRGQDISSRGQDIGAEKAGFNVEPSTTGNPTTTTPTLTPRDVSELPAVQQARIAAQEERTKYTKEQEFGGPLNNQRQANADRNYKARILGIENAKELGMERIRTSRELGMAHLEKPSSALESMGELAATTLPHIATLRNLIEEADKAGQIGALKGRVSDFLAGKVRTTGNAKLDALVGRLRGEDKYMAGAITRTHFGLRGGMGFYNSMLDGLNQGQAKELIMGNLDAFESYAKGYAQAAGVDIDNFNAGGSTAFNPQSMRVNRTPPPSPSAASSQLKRNTPPKGSKIIELKDLQ